MNSDTPLPLFRFGQSSRTLMRDRSFLIAGVVLLIIATACLLAPWLTPYDPIAQPDIIALKSVPPSLAHPFGTDSSSRDLLSRVMYGGRISLAVALFATIVSVTVGTAYGAAAGYVEGAIGAVLERVLDALLSIPRLLLLIAIFAAWNAPLKDFIIILGLTGWYGLARLVRGQVLALKGRDFVQSARALGATKTRILFRHVLPNVVSPVVVAATLGVGHVIVLEAGLSYLGIGVAIPNPSWGNILQDASDPLSRTWWISFFPGIAIVMTVMAVNVLGDRLLRALEPRRSVFG